MNTSRSRSRPSREYVNQSLAIMIVVLNDLCLGIGNGWTSPILSKLNRPTSAIKLTLREASWIASVEHIGKILGALISAILIDIIGRKKILGFCSLLFFLMWIVILSTKSIGLIVVVRITYGVAFGLNDGVNAVYLGEISSPVTRGIFSSVIMAVYYAGFLLELIVATYLSYTATSIVNVLITSSTFVGIYFLVEPAQYLLMRGKHKEAEKTFTWLKGVTNITEVQKEFDEIKRNVNSEDSKRASLKAVLTSPANYKSLLIMLVVYSLTGSIGYYPIMSYASTFFQSIPYFSPNELTIVFGIAQFVIGLFSLVSEPERRRLVLLVSFLLIAVLHAFTAFAYYIQFNVTKIPHFTWIIFIFITGYVCIISFVFPTLFVIRSELFPLSVKAAGASLSVIGYSITSFIMTYIFLHVDKYHGMHVNFIMFSFLCFLLTLFVYFTVPETRDKTLIEIQTNLEKKS